MMWTRFVSTVSDRATLYAMASRGWNVVAGLVTLVLISRCLTPELQGYYFTFASVLTFQTFLELGFGSVIQQFTSHEWARLSADSRGRIHGDRSSHQRLSSLVRLAIRWYAVVAALVVVGLGTGGSIYFYTFSKRLSVPDVPWQTTWWSLCLVSGMVLLLTPGLSILEGSNRVRGVYGLQLAQAVTSRTMLWIALLAGGGLWALAAGKAATFVVGIGFILWRYGSFFRNLLSEPPEHKIDWRREIWPLQWKFAVSWLSGYLLFSLFTPVLFAFHGPVLAGQMGMTLALVGTLSSVCYAMVATRVPRFAMAAARKDFAELDRLFYRAAGSAVIAASAGGIGLWFLLYWGNLLQISLAERFLPPLETGLLLSAAVIQQVRYAMGSYLRAHKREPYLRLSLAEGVGAAVGLSLLGVWLGARGVSVGFFLMTVILMVPAIVIFQRCRQRWHSQPVDPLGSTTLDGVSP